MDTRVRVMVVGGLYGSQPVGRELVLRLARHLAAGWGKKDREMQKLLQNSRIFLVPAVDVEGFNKAEPGNTDFLFHLMVLLNHGPYFLSSRVVSRHAKWKLFTRREKDHSVKLPSQLQ